MLLIICFEVKTCHCQLWMYYLNYSLYLFLCHTQVVAPRTFSLVCFRLLPPPSSEDNGNKLNHDLLESVNSTGSVFITHTVCMNYLQGFVLLITYVEHVLPLDDNHHVQVLSGEYILRFAVGAPLTEMRHVKVAWQILQDKATALLESL